MATRTTISDQRRKSYSKRAATGTLEILTGQDCPKCGHHKMFSTGTYIKCTRCTYRKLR